jgi:siroheme synthase
VLDKAYVIVYDRAVSELATLYAQYQAVVAVESQPMLEAMHQAALNQLRTNPDRFDHGWVIHDFHQRAQTLL